MGYVGINFRIKLYIPLLPLEFGKVYFLRLYRCLGLMLFKPREYDSFGFTCSSCLIKTGRLIRRFFQKELLLDFLLAGIVSQKWIKPVVVHDNGVAAQIL